MPPVLSTRNVLDHAPARSVRLGLKPPGLGLTIRCFAISRGHSGTLLIVQGRLPRPSTWVSPPWVIARHWITSSSLRRTSWTGLRRPPLRSPPSLPQGRLRRPPRCIPGWAHPWTPRLIQPENLCVHGGSHGRPRNSGSLARRSLCLLFRPWPRFSTLNLRPPRPSRRTQPSRTVIVPTPWASDQVIQAATGGLTTAG